MRKSFELLNKEEQKLFAWKIMRCIETNIPRKVSIISNIFGIVQAAMDMPELQDENKIPKMTQAQTLAAIVNTISMSNLMKILYSYEAGNNGINIADKLVQVFNEENMDSTNMPATLLRVSEFICQEFLNDGCKAN